VVGIKEAKKIKRTDESRATVKRRAGMRTATESRVHSRQIITISRRLWNRESWPSGDSLIGYRGRVARPEKLFLRVPSLRMLHQLQLTSPNSFTFPSDHDQFPDRPLSTIRSLLTERLSKVVFVEEVIPWKNFENNLCGGHAQSSSYTYALTYFSSFTLDH
jgi:hypothetical protein